MSGRSVSIIYGLAEGPQIGRGLIAVLRANGYQVTDDSDLVIAHSGGMYLLSESIRYDTVIIVAPSIGQVGEPVVVTQAKKTIREWRQAWQNDRLIQAIDMVVWNIIYLITRIPTNNRLAKQHRVHQPNLPIVNARRVIVIAYSNDTWSNSLINKAPLPESYKLVILPYEHDDIWYNPQRYLEYLAV